MTSLEDASMKVRSGKYDALASGVGRLPRKILIFVYRQTCGMCLGQRPYLVTSIRIQELKIIQWKTNEELVLETITLFPK
jgi:hypothetical protein